MKTPRAFVPLLTQNIFNRTTERELFKLLTLIGSVLTIGLIAGRRLVVIRGKPSLATIRQIEAALRSRLGELRAPYEPGAVQNQYPPERRGLRSPSTAGTLYRTPSVRWPSLVLLALIKNASLPSRALMLPALPQVSFSSIVVRPATCSSRDKGPAHAPPPHSSRLTSATS